MIHQPIAGDYHLSPSIPIYPAGKIQWYPLFLRLLVHLALILGIHHQASVIRLGQVPLQFQGAFGHLKNRCFQWDLRGTPTLW